MTIMRSAGIREARQNLSALLEVLGTLALPVRNLI